MSWEYDRGMILFLSALGVFILFCGIMAIRSVKKQKRLSPEERQLQQRISQEMGRRGVVLFFAILWLASGMLVFSLYEMELLDQTFKIPRVLSFFYDVFGISTGAIVQVVLSILVIFITIVSMIRKRRVLLAEFHSNE
ncbi:hypothetical protein [Candidatus Enterococcus murrayae]|uniref:Uncharacterized protein n=1 Tax=Candidatus Enterococcus murrayae TaxID=2815321 RepID=A0ABS3HCK6_9ENTE|nr:hypothetical protein [Enterococcus sp. MJM16]MBO0451171.1 hypothetical protein [Enterococcus sp. MJM16]